MLILGAIAFIGIVGATISIVLLVRAAKRLLEYDAVFARIAPALDEYAADLRKTLSSGILVDNPEVLNFHKRNVSFLAHVESIATAVKENRPPSPPQDPQKPAPRPDWE
jgi:hypothetical protein